MFHSHFFLQIFMSFMKGNQSNKYVTANFNLFKTADQYQFFRFLMVQMLFSQTQKAPGPNFRMVGKSLCAAVRADLHLCCLHIA